MSLKEYFYPEVKFGGFTDIDGTIAFYTRVNELIETSFILLDYGCGRGAYQEDTIRTRRSLRIFKNKIKKVIGIDLDPTASTNPYLDEFHLLENAQWPIDDNSVDICICDFVLEHIDDPGLFFSEARRVLKHNGYICIRTTNVWSYVGMISSIVPDKFHATLTSKVQDRRKEEDVFPILYKCNSISQINQMMVNYNFDFVVYGYEAEPAYLNFSKFFYWLGVLYQKFSPSFFRTVIFAFGRVNKDIGNS